MSIEEFTDADTWGGRPIARKIADAVPRRRVIVSGVAARSCVTVEGTAKTEDGRIVVWNPVYRIEPSDD